jgi:hypothetical protein
MVGDEEHLTSLRICEVEISRSNTSRNVSDKLVD